MAGLIALVVALAVATAFGLLRRRTDGRLRVVRTAGDLEPVAPPSAAQPQAAARATGTDGLPVSIGGVSIAAAPAGTGPGDVVSAGAPSAGAVLGVGDLGGPLGDRATLVQFSTVFCAPCRATRRVLADVASVVPGVVHVEIDAESRLDLVRRLDVLRTPTVLVLDGRGRVVRRAVGAPRKADVLAVLAGAVEPSVGG